MKTQTVNLNPLQISKEEFLGMPAWVFSSKVVVSEKSMMMVHPCTGLLTCDFETALPFGLPTELEEITDAYETEIKVKGTILDLFTANAVCQVWDACSPELKVKIMDKFKAGTFGLEAGVNWVWRCCK